MPQGGGSSGGSFTPVGVYLQVRNTPLDIHAQGTYPFHWDDARDNPWDFNQLLSLPARLGISTAIDGTDGTLTTTVAGVWAFTLGMNTAPDATWKGTLHLDDNTAAEQSGQAVTSGAHLTVTEVCNYPSGAVVGAPLATTLAGATANPFNVGPSLLIVRLA